MTGVFTVYSYTVNLIFLEISLTGMYCLQQEECWDQAHFIQLFIGAANILISAFIDFLTTRIFSEQMW